MRAPRIVVMLVVGVLTALLGLMEEAAALGIPAATAGGGRDGYLATPTFELASDTYAVTAEELALVPAPGRWAPWGDRLDLIVGCNRWVYRVIAYAALMTDTYPPFRLDPGADEPHPALPTPTSGPSETQQPARSSRGT